MTTIIFIGRSGSGKGTQAQLLIDYFRSQTPPQPVIYIETGRLVRQFMAGESWTQERVRTVVNSGGFLPAFLAARNWTNFLIEEYQGHEHLLVDGTPRTRLEAEAFDEALQFYGRQDRPRATILLLAVTAEEITTRLLKRARQDDTPAGIQSRLAEFDKKVLPVLDYYRANPDYQLIEIDGNRSIEAIHQDILERLRL